MLIWLPDQMLYNRDTFAKVALTGDGIGNHQLDPTRSTLKAKA